MHTASSEDHSTFGRNFNINCLTFVIQKDERTQSFLVFMFLDKRDYKMAPCLSFSAVGIGG